MKKLIRIIQLAIGILVLLILIAAIVIGYNTCAGGHVIQRIDKTLPDKSIASLEVTTVTRIYYTESARKNDDGSVTMAGWYSKINGEWVYDANTITLPPVLHPNIGKRL